MITLIPKMMLRMHVINIVWVFFAKEVDNTFMSNIKQMWLKFLCCWKTLVHF